MKIHAEPEWISALSSSARNSLAVNNARIVEGSDKILVNPAYESISDEEVFKKLETLLSNCELTPKLRQIEDSNRERYGARSIAVGWGERKESLRAYFNKEDFDPGDFTDSGYGGRRPQSLTTVVNSLIKRSSSGLPYMTRKGNVLQKSLQNFANERGVYPCVLFTRTQEQAKTRNVWGYPISDTIEEQRYFLPWLQYEKTLAYRNALHGPDAVDIAVTNLISKRSGGTDEIYAVDFEQYDASIEPSHAYDAFSEVASLFQSQYHSELYGMFRRFVTIPIYTPDGSYVGPHGVPSGSSWTNTIDSLVQFRISGVEGHTCQVQGDDGIYLLPEGKHEVLADNFISNGLKLNQSKSDLFKGDEALFLQRYYHPNYKSRTGPGLGGVYSAYRAFARIKYLERWTDFEAEGIKGSDFFSLRTIMILENCKHHPGFEAIVRLAHSLDRNGLRFSNEGVKAYSRGIESRARAGVLHTESLAKGIDKFEAVKLLRTL